MKKVLHTVLIILLLAINLVACSGTTQCEHNWINATCTQSTVCSLCGETEGLPLGHDWLNATCTSPKTCKHCNQTKGIAIGHTEVVDKAVAPTCTTTGLTEGKHCSVCNKITIMQEIIQPQHKISDWKLDKNPTCTTRGSQYKECLHCHAVLETRYLLSLGHDIGAGLKCIRCDYQLEACKLNTSYVANDNLTITLNRFTYTEYTGYVEYNITYTITNNVPDSKIHYGLFYIVKSDGSREPSGGWSYIYYGETITRFASWKMLKTESPILWLTYMSDYNLRWLPPQ